MEHFIKQEVKEELIEVGLDVTEEEEIAAIDFEVTQLEAQIVKLKDRKNILTDRKTKLKDLILKRKSQKLANRNWSGTNFPWSSKVDEVLQNVFKIPQFRELQLEAINATLSKEDTILIMPTGGGKSLCYQLPALIDDGITLVVSPLVSLMEDQIMGLKKLKIPAVMLSASSSKGDVHNASAALLDHNSKIKLVYVTPERLAKSKRFMSQLQKCSTHGRLARLAVDEVHCCSTWGHDFRPDYNFLGVLRAMFPDTPLIGLTATSTAKVTLDVQKMLNIGGCLVLKATFNRPNLFYEVVPKPTAQNECLDFLHECLTQRFKNQTGIIYTTAIKDCEELSKQLRERGVSAACYHAMMESEHRSKTHEKWMGASLQVVVATIAFGLGIDKPNVRFVIHHSLSKSMENFYQESGRAGRDGEVSYCIIMYRLLDVFKLSAMVFTQQTGLENLYKILAYCLDVNRCRRTMIAEHFEEVWHQDDCRKMCDHCKNPRSARILAAASHCRSLCQLIRHAAGLDLRLTANKILDAWFNKGDVKLRHPNVKPPSLSREAAEAVIGHLLVEGYLKEDFRFTAYSTISYILRGPRAALVDDKLHEISVSLPGLREKQSVSVRASNTSVAGSSSSNSMSLKTPKREKGEKGKGKKELKRKSDVVELTIDSGSEEDVKMVKKGHKRNRICDNDGDS